MTKKKREVVGRFGKLVANQGGLPGIHTERLNEGQGWPPGDCSSARLPDEEKSGEG